MLLLAVVLAFVVVSPAFSYDAPGKSSEMKLAKGCCPGKKAAAKKICDDCKDKKCCKDNKCTCTDVDCKCECKENGCTKAKGKCPKAKGGCSKKNSCS